MADADGDDDDDLDWSAFDIDAEQDTPCESPPSVAQPEPHIPVQVATSSSNGATWRQPMASSEIRPSKRRRKADVLNRNARREAGAAFHQRTRLTDISDASNEPKCINLDREEGEEPVYLPVTINPYLKAHQLEGIRFLWNHIVRQPDPRLRGCVLAHSMGLGKTMQTVMFIYLFLRHQIGTRVLIVSPKSTLFSWADEAEGWCARCQLGRMRVRTLDESCKRIEERREMVEQWLRCGGILLIGYEMFTLLSGVGRAKAKSRTKEEDLLLFKEAFQDPGPDLVICDEGHRLKNSKLLVVVALKSLATTRRVVLTGTPLQNHLMEYFCMVDFVRESYWTRKEFRELFDAPIKAGQHDESTPEEVRIMKRRAYALSNELKTFVLRRDQSILMKELPPKHEFVLVIRLSPLQQQLCRNFVNAYSFQRRDTLYFTSMLNKICAHPDILRDYILRVQKYGSGQKTKVNGFLDDAGIDLNDWIPSEDEEGEVSATKTKGPSRKDENTEERDFSWASCIMTPDYQEGVLHNSSKMWVLYSIIEKCLCRGEKLLVFSMWTSVLDMVARFLKNYRHPLTRAQWLARCRKGTQVRDSVTLQQPTSNELGDILMTLKWRRRDIEGVLQLWEDPRMKTLQECNSEEDNVLLQKLRADLEQQARVVDEQVQQVQKKKEQLFGQDCLSDDDTCDAALRPFVGYCRIDGGTSSAERQAQIQEFNDPTSEKQIFLISTKAGGVGITLTAASRVVIFDVSWNPSDEAQAIFRTYRYGQNRPVMIYRLVAEGTPEEKIYDLKVGKEWLFKKIVDEMAPSRAFVKQSATLDTLFEYKEEEDFQHPQEAISRMNRKVRCMNNDPLLTYVYANNVQTIRKMFPHESLLIDDFGEQIDDTEMAASMAEYQQLRMVHAMRAANEQQQQQQHQMQQAQEAQALAMIAEGLAGWPSKLPTPQAHLEANGNLRPNEPPQQQPRSPQAPQPAQPQMPIQQQRKPPSPNNALFQQQQQWMTSSALSPNPLLHFLQMPPVGADARRAASASQRRAISPLLVPQLAFPPLSTQLNAWQHQQQQHQQRQNAMFLQQQRLQQQQQLQQLRFPTQFTPNPTTDPMGFLQQVALGSPSFASAPLSATNSMLNLGPLGGLLGSDGVGPPLNLGNLMQLPLSPAPRTGAENLKPG